MAKLIGKDVTEQDIENLFDHNDTSNFVKNENNESLIPKELDAKSDSNSYIERPDQYQPDNVHEKKLQLKKEENNLKNLEKEQLLQISGNVSQSVFNEISKLREKAKLEEFVLKQRKLPVISPNAKYKLYNNQPECTFHVYQIISLLDNNRYLATCKFCSVQKIFNKADWLQYELENRQYM